MYLLCEDKTLSVHNLHHVLNKVEEIIPPRKLHSRPAPAGQD